MDQLAQIKKRTKPHDVLLVVDAMTGQDAVNVAEAFAEATAFDGVILSQARRRRPRRRRAVGQGDHRQADPVRLDRREARRVRALPPRPDGAADPRHGRRDDPDREGRGADRRASRPRTSSARSSKNQFTLDDFLEQMQQVRSMGPLQNILKMMPGVGQQLGALKVDDKELDRLQAIITSMTPAERANPKIIDGSRRRRIAAGSGTNVQAVSHLVKQFAQMQKVMRQIAQGQDALAAAAGRGPLTCSPSRSSSAQLRLEVKSLGRTSPADPRGQQEEPDLARRRRRRPLAARWPLHRDDRPLQPADAAVDDRARPRAPPALARPGRPADEHGQEADAQPETDGPSAPAAAIAEEAGGGGGRRRHAGARSRGRRGPRPRPRARPE